MLESVQPQFLELSRGHLESLVESTFALRPTTHPLWLRLVFAPFIFLFHLVTLGLVYWYWGDAGYAVGLTDQRLLLVPARYRENIIFTRVWQRSGQVLSIGLSEFTIRPLQITASSGPFRGVYWNLQLPTNEVMRLVIGDLGPGPDNVRQGEQIAARLSQVATS